MSEKLEIGQDIMALAVDLLSRCRERGELVVTAESCTGGLLAATMTAIPGCSDCFERGFVTYSNVSKSEMLGVPVWLIERHGAVSEDVARAMVGGALTHSRATLGISITGIAGPDGGTEEKPVGLVHFAAGRRDTEITHERVLFGDLGRTNVQREAVAHALALLMRLVSLP
jgi:nicotinamide-nucleotide amidase